MTTLTDPTPHNDYSEKQPGQWRRKGENGPPIVTDPDGVTTQKGTVALRTYARPSNFGKQVENTYNLVKWNERMVALGLAASMSEEVREALYAGEGHHDSPEWKAIADGIVVHAKRQAGAMVKAEQGTVGHQITEDSDLGHSIITRIEQGEDVGLPAPIQLLVREAWERLIGEHFEILAVEFPCVYDRWRVAGTGDRIVRLKHDLVFNTPQGWITLKAGTVLVLDIKTGGLKTDSNGLPQYWHSYAVQICAYARSLPYDVDTEKRGWWPLSWHGINPSHALIAHLDIGRALDTGEMVAQLLYVDIDAGWEAGELVCRAKDWQRRKDIFSTVGQHVVTLEAPALSVEPDTTGARAATRPAPVDDRSMIVARAKALVDAGHGKQLAYEWPTYPDGKPIPGFKSDHDHTPAELDAIRIAVCQIEDEQSFPFHEADAPTPDLTPFP